MRQSLEVWNTRYKLSERQKSWQKVKPVLISYSLYSPEILPKTNWQMNSMQASLLLMILEICEQKSRKHKYNQATMFYPNCGKALT